MSGWLQASLSASTATSTGLRTGAPVTMGLADMPS